MGLDKRFVWLRSSCLVGRSHSKSSFSGSHAQSGCDAWYWRKWKGKDVANTAYALGLWRQSADDHGEHRRCVVIDAIALDTHEYVNVLWAMSEFRVKGSHLCHVTRPLEPLCFRASRALQTSGHGKSTGQVACEHHRGLELCELLRTEFF